MSPIIRQLLNDVDYLIGCKMACDAVGERAASRLYFNRAAELLDEAMELACQKEPAHV